MHFALLAAGTIAIKGVVFPWLLFRAIREAEIAREIEPYVGYVASLVAGVVALGASFWMCTRLPIPEDIASPWLVPVSFFSIFAGLFLIVSRKRAVNQVLGFLVLENGIYTFGVGRGGANAVPGRGGRAAGRVCGGVRHGHHHLPHQPRVRSHRHRPAEHVERLRKFMIYDLRFTIVRSFRRARQIVRQIGNRQSAIRNQNDSRPGHSAFACRSGGVCSATAGAAAWLVGRHGAGSCDARRDLLGRNAGTGAGRLAGAGCGRAAVSEHHELSVFDGVILCRRLSRPGSEPARHRPGGRIFLRQRAGSGFHRLPAFVSGGDDPGDGQPALWPALGGHRSHDTGERAADLFSPAPSLTGSDLEISAHLLGRHRAGLAGEFLSRCGGDTTNQATLFRWCCRTWSRTPRLCKHRG